MAYSKYFIKYRPFILMAYDFKCLICSYRSISNHVHHVDFNSLNDHSSNFVVLCKFCHNHVHKCKIKIKQAEFIDLREVFKGLI